MGRQGGEVRLFGFQRPGGPARNCTVDGAPASTPQHARVLCEWKGPAGNHILRFSASEGQSTFVDKVEYIPQAGADVPPNSAISFNHGDTAIQYKGQWAHSPDLGAQTSDPNARVELEFEGK